MTCIDGMATGSESCNVSAARSTNSATLRLCMDADHITPQARSPTTVRLQECGAWRVQFSTGLEQGALLEGP